jgi:hypothetical protein
LDFGFTQLFKQEFSEQPASSITGLISTESNSKSEACEVEALISSTIKAGLLYEAYSSNYHLRNFSRDFQIPLIYTQVYP